MRDGLRGEEIGGAIEEVVLRRVLGLVGVAEVLVLFGGGVGGLCARRA